MNIDSIMTSNVIKITLDDHLFKIREIFEKYQFHHLLVMDEEELVGVISDRDFLREVSPFVGTNFECERDISTLNKKAHQIMSRKLITISKEENIKVAAENFLKNDVSCLPVVSEDGKVEGIVTCRDVIREYLNTDVIKNHMNNDS